jgi:hypothetical protein
VKVSDSKEELARGRESKKSKLCDVLVLFFSKSSGEAGIVPLYACLGRHATLSFFRDRIQKNHETLWFAVWQIVVEEDG